MYVLRDQIAAGVTGTLIARMVIFLSRDQYCMRLLIQCDTEVKVYLVTRESCDSTRRGDLGIITSVSLPSRSSPAIWFDT